MRFSATIKLGQGCGPIVTATFDSRPKNHKVPPFIRLSTHGICTSRYLSYIVLYYTYVAVLSIHRYAFAYWLLHANIIIF